MLASSEKPFTLEEFSRIINYANTWNSTDKSVPEIQPKEVFRSIFTRFAANILIKKLNTTHIEKLRNNKILKQLLRKVLVSAIIPRHSSEINTDGQNIWHSILGMKQTVGYVIDLTSYYLNRNKNSWLRRKELAYTIVNPEKSFPTYVLSMDPENRNDPDIVTYSPQESIKTSLPERIKVKTPDYLLSQMLLYLGLLLEKKFQKETALLAYTCAEILYPQPNTLVSMGHMHLRNIDSDPQALDKANAINKILQKASAETAVAQVFQGHIHMAYDRKEDASKAYSKAFDKFPHLDRLPDLILTAEDASEEVQWMVSRLRYPQKDQYEYISKWFANAFIRYHDGETTFEL